LNEAAAETTTAAQAPINRLRNPTGYLLKIFTPQAST